jgi:hypothetical protein
VAVKADRRAASSGRGIIGRRRKKEKELKKEKDVKG